MAVANLFPPLPLGHPGEKPIPDGTLDADAVRENCARLGLPGLICCFNMELSVINLKSSTIGALEGTATYYSDISWGNYSANGRHVFINDIVSKGYPITLMMVASRLAGQARRGFSLGVTTGNGNNMFYLGSSGTGACVIGTSSSTGSLSEKSTTSTLAENKPGLFAGVFSASNSKKAFLEGEFASDSSDRVADHSLIASAVVGNAINSTGYHWGGKIFFAAAFNADLTAWLASDWTRWPALLAPRPRIVYVDLGGAPATFQPAWAARSNILLQSGVAA